jgi:hypothetical protein
MTPRPTFGETTAPRHHPRPGMHQMTRRFAVLAATASGLMLLTLSSASAAPPNKTSLALSCDRGTQTATIVVTLRDTRTGVDTAGPFTLECGSDSTIGTKSTRAVETTPFFAGYAVIQRFDITTATEFTTCGAEGTLPLKNNCSDSAGVGATITIR